MGPTMLPCSWPSITDRTTTSPSVYRLSTSFDGHMLKLGLVQPSKLVKTHPLERYSQLRSQSSSRVGLPLRPLVHRTDHHWLGRLLIRNVDDQHCTDELDTQLSPELAPYQFLSLRFALHLAVPHLADLRHVQHVTQRPPVRGVLANGFGQQQPPRAPATAAKFRAQHVCDDEP